VNDVISMRALLLSGASIDVDTRMKPISWIDIVKKADSNSVVVRATGAEPNEEKKVIRIGEDSWSAQLDIERPVIYLKGEGGIPLRQEFVVVGTIRSEKVNVPYVLAPPQMTYYDEVSGVLNAPTGVALAPLDKLATVEAIGDNRYRWTLKNLESDRKNQRFVKVKIGGEDFVGAHEVTRGIGKEFSISGNILKSAEVKWTQWLSPTWGYLLNWEKVIFKGSSDPDLSWISLRVLYRLQPALHLTKDSFYFGLGFDSFSAASQSILSPTITFGQISKAAKWAASTFQYQDWFVEYGTGGNAGGVTLSSAIRASYLLRAEFRKQNFLTVGLKIDSYSVSDGATSSSLTWPMASIGYIFLF
jgi:hypothetical protein